MRAPSSPCVSPPADKWSLEIGPPMQETPSTEAFVEDVRRCGTQVEVRLLLADGNGGVAQIEAAEWDWLEMRTGDIVPVRLPGRSLSV